MVMMGIPFLILSIYLVLVVGTLKKFKQEGIGFKGKLKYFSFFIPIVIIGLHLFWSIKAFINRDTRLGKVILRMSTIDYPILLGLISETVLELRAIRLAGDPRLIKAKKKRKQRKIIESQSSKKIKDSSLAWEMLLQLPSLYNNSSSSSKFV